MATTSSDIGSMAAATSEVPRLLACDVRKSFPGVLALKGVSLDVRAGEVHALLGENGAGKSTFGKIVAGVYPTFDGRITFDGMPLENMDESKVGALGIGIVHQEGSLVPQLSIAENIFAGRQPAGFLGRIDQAAMRRRARLLLEELGVVLDPRLAVRHLSTAQAQVVEIAKALSRDLKLLILDEPTSALTQAETQRLFVIVRRLRAAGVSVVYVSHRLAEIFELCDRVTVLKDGRVTGTRVIGETDEAELIRLMVGRDVLFARCPATRPGPAMLHVAGLAVPPFVRDATLTVHAGEIVCLAGLVGSGRSELCEAVFGARRPTRGTIALSGRPVRWTGPWDAMQAGIGMVPEDRKEAGLFLDASIMDNIGATVLSKVSPGGIVSQQLLGRMTDHFIAELRIAASSRQQVVGNLSGGNQQKVLLAKWLATEPRLLIVDEPTRGVDVGARAEIYRILRKLKADGLAILVVSSDLPEVLTLADRIVVMAEGRTVGERPGEGATEEDVLRLATNAGAGATSHAVTQESVH